MKRLRIEICGGIASGKTTLASIIGGQTGAVMENFRHNPYWRAFYLDPAHFAFETEVSFLLQHYHQLKVETGDTGLATADFSLLLDRAYADVTLRSGQLVAFNAVYTQVREELGDPRLLVCLRCGATEQLRRIRRRRRRPERGIHLEFLEELNRSLEKQVDLVRGSIPILEIDSEHRDFAHDDGTANEVLQEITGALDVQRQTQADVQSW
ncbi:MAG: deoxynucleoside kinase [Rhodospirillales bacterium]|nr:deoxynucleoside kinase [Rhodospirillales bacterium]